MSKYFSLSEFLQSDTAAVRGIDNTPSFEVVEHLAQLAEVLDGLREAWGSAVNVSSCYRCPELNKAVGGSDTSAHLYGYAADLIPANGKMDAFERCAVEYFKSGCIPFDQLIREKSGKTRWLHIGLYNASGKQRGQILNITK